jgi:hypothetical protein
VLPAVPPETVNFKGGSLARLHFPEMKPGLPSELLLRRPDIAAAEAGLGSQQFSVLQARAAFFPSIQMTGLYGVQSVAFKTLFRPDAIAWQIAGNLTQPLFDGYNLQGQFMLQQGRYAEVAQVYKKTILTAFSDTENALIAIAETSRQLELQAYAVAAAKSAYEAEHGRLTEGVIDIATLSIPKPPCSKTRICWLWCDWRIFKRRQASSRRSAAGGRKGSASSISQARTQPTRQTKVRGHKRKAILYLTSPAT